MTDLSNLSKEAREALMDMKMKEIRRKNEELKKRHEEIEADKRNAELLSSLVQNKKPSMQSTPPPQRSKTNDSVTQPPAVNVRVNRPVSGSYDDDHKVQQAEKVNTRPSTAGRGKMLQRLTQEKLKAPEYQQRQQRLKENEGPPPDPSYSFLHDRSRESKVIEDRRQGSRRHFSNFGGQDFDNVKNTMQMRKSQERQHPTGPPRNKLEMSLRMTGRERKEYENWRVERERIEEDRLSRQKTSTGEWRREWDKDKIIQDENPPSGWQQRNYRDGRGRAGGGGGRSGRGGRGGYDGHPYEDHGPYNKDFRGRGRGRGGRGRGVRRTNSGNKSESEHSTDTHEEDEIDKELLCAAPSLERKVQVEHDSLKICISNEFADEKGTGTENTSSNSSRPPPSPRNQRQPPRKVGSGRVLSTSSQSEDERGGPDFRPPRRGKPQRNAEERGLSRAVGRNAPKEQRPPRQGRSSDFSGQHFEKEQVGTDNSIESTTSDTNPVTVVLPSAVVIKDSMDETCETGEESWEDVTTSGNESLELSGPTDESHNDSMRHLEADEIDFEAHMQNLSGDSAEMNGPHNSELPSLGKEILDWQQKEKNLDESEIDSYKNELCNDLSSALESEIVDGAEVPLNDNQSLLNKEVTSAEVLSESSESETLNQREIDETITNSNIQSPSKEKESSLPTSSDLINDSFEDFPVTATESAETTSVDSCSLKSNEKESTSNDLDLENKTNILPNDFTTTLSNSLSGSPLKEIPLETTDLDVKIEAEDNNCSKDEISNPPSVEGNVQKEENASNIEAVSENDSGEI